MLQDLAKKALSLRVLGLGFTGLGFRVLGVSGFGPFMAQSGSHT